MMRAHTSGTWVLSKRRLALRLSIVAACAVLGAAAIVVAPSWAGAAKMYQSRVTLDDSPCLRVGCFPFWIHGTVESKKDRCRNHRHVTVFWNRRDDGTPWQKLGSDETDHADRWKVQIGREGPLGPLRFYAVARERRVTVNGDGFVCEGDRSRWRGIFLFL